MHIRKNFSKYIKINFKKYKLSIETPLSSGLRSTTVFEENIAQMAFSSPSSSSDIILLKSHSVLFGYSKNFLIHSYIYNRFELNKRIELNYLQISINFNIYIIAQKLLPKILE